MNPLELLQRSDKWFLGGGGGAIWAPPFPRWLETPGFWDECFLADVRIDRLFTVLAAGSDGKPLRLRGERGVWRPDRLHVTHRAPGVEIAETRCVLHSGVWVSELRVLEAPGPLSLFLWSLRDLRPLGYGAPWSSVVSADAGSDSMVYRLDTAWPARLEPDRTAVEEAAGTGGSNMLPPFSLYFELGASAERASWTINLAQRHDDSPIWETSVLPQKLCDGRLPQDRQIEVGPAPIEGMLHLVQQYLVRPGESLRFACAAGLSPQQARSAFEEGQAENAIYRSEREWTAFFGSVPQLWSSDPHLTAAYWHRWYGLRLNTVDMPGLPMCRHPGAGAAFSPYVTEGVGFFRSFITYSAQAHLRELVWMREPRLAMAILDNLAKVQREDGSFPGHSYSCRSPRDFYHADFATGLRALAALHGVELAAWLPALERYLAYLVARQDPEGAILVFDQNETGQEYMSRYAFASESADQWCEFRLAGVDATCYALSLAEFLAEQESPGADAVARKARLALEKMFDRGRCIWVDRKPDGSSSTVASAVGLYPLLYLAGGRPECIEAVHQWLTNPREFWLPKGFPSTPMSDPAFNPFGEWKGRRMSCPWSGRSWPMVGCHLVDALARVARSLPLQAVVEAPVDAPAGAPPPGAPPPAHLSLLAGEALMKTVRLMFHDGDPSRPNSYEHYDPLSGVPALYRGYDDYMHSWIVDLILRCAVGVVPGADHVDPLPLDIEWIDCRGIPHPRGFMNVRVERGRVHSVQIDDTEPSPL